MRLNKFIDHTLLKPNASIKDIEKLCNEAIEYHFYSICVNPCFVSFASNYLKESDVKICTVVGFPLGQNTINTKVFETKQAVQDGADEIDVVINVSALIDGYLSYVKKEIDEVVEAAFPAIVKVIIETCYLTEEQKKQVCTIILKSGAKFVKTSTGFGIGGATEEDVRLLKSFVGKNIEVKASGGIKNFETCKNMIDAGATRIGTSSGIKICEENKDEKINTRSN